MIVLVKSFSSYVFILVFVLCTTFSHSQTISERNLKNTAWFCSVGDSIYDMFEINLKMGDTTIWFKKNEKIHPNENGFGKYELLVLKTDIFANFYFNPKKNLNYFITDGNMHYVTIIGQMPQWTWKYKRGKLKLYREGKKTFSFKTLLLRIRKLSGI